jgi:uncharacterized protein YcbK (DUF882 family)
MQLTKNFYKIEFDCRDNSLMPLDVLDSIKKLAKNLQKVRDILNEPIHINSGYRSESHNKKIGGTKHSKHLIGYAADITTMNYTSKELALLFEKLIANGTILQGGLGLYNGFIHYDIRGSKARWNHSSKYKNFY